MIAKDKTNNRNVFIMIGLSQNADNPSMKSNHRPSNPASVKSLYAKSRGLFYTDVGSTLAVESIRFGSGRLDVPSTITFSLDVWIDKAALISMASPRPCLDILVVEPVMKRKLNEEELLARIDVSSSAP